MVATSRTVWPRADARHRLQPVHLADTADTGADATEPIYQTQVSGVRRLRTGLPEHFRSAAVDARAASPDIYCAK
jgi:hypothetical protein